jgi:hypothetical protein
MKGDFFFPWRVNTGLPVVRSNMVVDVPVGLNPRIWEKSLTFKRSERVAGGRKIYTWVTSNVPVVKIEPFTPDSLIPVGRITVTAPFDWRAVAKWYSGLVQPAYNVTPTVADKISKVVAGARTLDDSIRAVHKWVSQDIRYVAIELGRGGYVPRDAETVVRTGFGDCKDKTMLFLAALRKMGVTGYPVLLNLVGTVRQESPAIEQFNHVIAAVQRENGYVFSDLTAESYPFGVVPGEEQGKFGVMVRNDGGDEVHLPTAESGPSRFTERIVGELTDSGMFNGVFTQIIEGSEATVFRRLFSRPTDSTRRASFARMIASSRFPGADGDSLQMSDEKSSSSSARMSVHIRNGKVMSSVGNVHLLTNPIHPMTSFASIASTLEREGKRTMPIDLGRVLRKALETSEIKLTLPSGWTASLPKNKSMSGPFGRYEEVYAQNGRELTISRTIDGAKGVLPADKMGDLIAWLKFIGNDDAKLIVLQKP